MPFKPANQIKNLRSLTSVLNSARIQTKMPALYQTIAGILDNAQSNQELFSTRLDTNETQLTELIKALDKQLTDIKNRLVTIHYIDTNGGPVSIPIPAYVDGQGFVIFKDSGGVASTNPITLVGTVNGLGVDPQINTDWGFIHIVTQDRINYHTW